MFKKLDFVTYRQKMSVVNETEYFYGSRDQMKTHNQSKVFCKNWGGELLSIDSETEYKSL